MRHDATANGDADEPFDLEHAKEQLRFFLRAPLRHPVVAALVFIALAAVGIVGAVRAQPIYESKARILIQKNIPMPTVGENNRNGQAEFDPTMGVYETVKGRENLLALARETHLGDKIDVPSSAFGHPPSADEKLEYATKWLDWRLEVQTEGGVVTFVARWTDPRTAYDLVTGAARRFFDARNAAEVSVIGDAIALFEEHARAEREGIDTALQEFLKLKEGWSGGSPSSTSSEAPQGSAPARARLARANVGPDPELAQKLDDQRRRIRETEDDWRRQLSDAKSRLAQLLTTLTPSHPSVVAAQRRVDALSQEPAQLGALKSEEREMLNELTSAAGATRTAGGAGRVSAPGSPATREAGQPRTAQDLELIDPQSALALSKLQNRVRKYEDFMDQISAAKLQLELARNTFKYRYKMFTPAEIPRKPRWPVHLFWLGGGFGLALFLAIGASAIIDLARGRFIEPWQVKRRLDLPLLGEVPPPGR
jgi:uncharacterized protein involved in exopolysaccharide biosynthesis